ncbi:Hypothetical predicted protein [Mytilus galloprovincialis]|uniref:Uncharacterized protein n=1 Tax=Mytilus galloprovincialis TaxID=29158 RepID=A0A8B6GS21_MYTGA|nr:Hypothetical predicted protein [Mytilus galloprovincialis]
MPAELTLPNFSGNIFDWQSFQDSFKSSEHMNPSLPWLNSHNPYSKVFREGEDEIHAIAQDQTVTAQLIQRTLTGTTAEIKWHCGKVCMNLNGLTSKIHQIRTNYKCGSEKQQRKLTVSTDETKEDHRQEAHYIVGDLLPNEAT